MTDWQAIGYLLGVGLVLGLLLLGVALLTLAIVGWEE